MSPTVLIVGANRGLGLQFALQYLNKGFKVYGTYRMQSFSEAHELLGSGATALNLDLDVGVSIQGASEMFGDQPLDILINCASEGNGNYNWLDIPPEELMRKFRVSAVGPFLTIKAFHHQLKMSKSPLVVNISSALGSMQGNNTGGNLSYRTSKAALHMITVDLARELAVDNISCVALSPGPGFVKTRMTGFTGTVEAPEAVAFMISIIDRLKPQDMGGFYNRDGQRIPW
ncbi:short chain dehydrogenase [Cercophora newfieldiana]|uniref:Short chain dehydrogenase n=1 Tax=Cercophora newfieldiana TaxID=92897 RepID=A0AA39XTJ5_9PEZI|nr:short chain dehydrogenase [Cercophora newfieldiana]